MEAQNVFLPERRTGLIVHIGAAILLIGASLGSFLLAQRQIASSYFVLLLLLSVALLLPLALILYRGYALLRANYILEREGLRLRWGLRSEDIPLPAVEWVRPASELGYPLRLPLLRLPGGILGVVNAEGLGPVEFMAATSQGLLLVATAQRVYAISPADPAAFLRVFQRTIEMGSLTPLEAHSARPAAFFQRAWGNRQVRGLLLAGTGVTLLLFILVGMLIPTSGDISLGYSAPGSPAEPMPAIRLLLLPVLAVFTLVADFIGGLFFYRRPEAQPIAYLLWASSILTPVLLIIAVLLLIL